MGKIYETTRVRDLDRLTPESLMLKSDNLYAEWRGTTGTSMRYHAELLRQIAKMLYDAEHWNREGNPRPMAHLMRNWAGIIAANLLDHSDMHRAKEAQKLLDDIAKREAKFAATEEGKPERPQPPSDGWLKFLRAWHAEFGDRPIRVKELIESDIEPLIPTVWVEGVVWRLTTPGTWVHIGNALRKRVDKPIGGLVLRSHKPGGPNSNKTNAYWVEEI